MSDTDIRGRFVWYELMTTDVKAAEAFYTKVVGWGLQTYQGAGTPYVTWMRGKEGVGGLMELPEEARKMGAPPNWMAYVGVPSVDSAVIQATQAGARVLVPAQDIPTVGRFAVLADPHGAVLAVFTPGSDAPGRDTAPQVGEFSWHELVTTDHAAALAFYSALFGWESTGTSDMGPMGIYQMFGRKGRTLGGMFNKPADMPAPPHWLLYVRVKDVRMAAELVKALGGQVLMGPVEVPGEDWIVQCLDPQGAVFALHERKAPVAG
jgi:uncharacterized protein